MGKAACHPHEEELRRLDHRTLFGMTQQVSVAHGPEAEVLEPVVVVLPDREVELPCVHGDKLGRVVVNQAQPVPQGDGLTEGGDQVAPDLLVDVVREQAGRQTGVLRLLCDELSSGLDGELVKFGGGRAVIDAADGLGGDTHGLDVV